tara:strand:+ start:868 stop:1833 length:966 start_codon:yes stop_codon:yes gene_type:complete
MGKGSIATNTHSTFFKTAGSGTVLVLLLGGFLCLIIGILVAQLDYDAAKIIGDILVKGSSAVLGAGVFAALMKSAQFTQIFQNQIFEVFHDPKKLGEIVDVATRWNVLTHSRLRDVLPAIHEIATSKINEAFFDDELEYHFEDYEHTYDIRISDEKMIIRNTFDAQVTINPTCESPTFIQKFTSDFDGIEVKLRDLEIGNTPIDNAQDYLKQDESNANLYKLSYKLNFKNKIRVRRTIEYTQCLKKEPYINVVIGRYIKGAVVSVKINDGYKVNFVNSGLGTFGRNVVEGERADGFKTWTLAQQDSLLLPGTGYILIVTEV